MAVLGTAKQFQMFSLGLGMDATAPTSEDFWSSMLEQKCHVLIVYDSF